MHELSLDSMFIGGHPMARSERIEFVNSKASFLENTYYIITKTPEADGGKLKEYEELVQSINAIPLIMTPEEYDLVTATVSHVPRVIFAPLVNLMKDNDSSKGEMRMIATRRFNDITRILPFSPIMWQQICLTNLENTSSL